jgi:hypothetical protein
MREESSSAFPSFFPIILLAVSLLILLVWQVVNVRAQAGNLKATKAQLVETLKQREPQEQQAIQLQNQFRALTLDLLELAKTDPKAQSLIKKYSIPPAPATPEPGK